MQRAVVYFIAVFALVVGSYMSAFAAKRVALVIGNSAYEQVARLPNPASDARAVAAALKRLGFAVTLKLDQDYSALRRTLGAFSRTAAGADIATIFYAGHGIEVGGQNYLIPIDAKLAHANDVDFEAIPLATAMGALESAKGLKLAILDACRNNPFTARMARSGATRAVGRGLARVSPRGSDTLVAYAAKEGTTADDGEGRNSPYTAALLKHLETPGLELRLLFGRVRDSVLAGTGQRQEPFTYGSLGGEAIYLKGGNGNAEDTLSQTVAPATVNPAVAVWKDVQNTNSESVLGAFLKQFPDGVYAKLANARLQEIKKANEDKPAPSAPAPQRQALAPPLRPSVSARINLLDNMTPKSNWAIATRKNCNKPSKVYSLTFNSPYIVWRDGIGNVDIELVVSSSTNEFRTRTHESKHITKKNVSVGQTWTYRKLGSGRILVSPGGKPNFQIAKCS